MVSESKRQIAHNLDRRQKSEAKLFPKKIMHNNKFATSIYSHVRHFVFDCFFFQRGDQSEWEGCIQEAFKKAWRKNQYRSWFTTKNNLLAVSSSSHYTKTVPCSCRMNQWKRRKSLSEKTRTFSASKIYMWETCPITDVPPWFPPF